MTILKTYGRKNKKSTNRGTKKILNPKIYLKLTKKLFNIGDTFPIKKNAKDPTFFAQFLSLSLFFCFVLFFFF